MSYFSVFLHFGNFGKSAEISFMRTKYSKISALGAKGRPDKDNFGHFSQPENREEISIFAYRAWGKSKDFLPKYLPLEDNGT